MEKRWARIVLIIVLFISPPLVWSVNILLNIYPESQKIEIVGPGTGSYHQIAFGHEQRCVTLYWGFHAETNNVRSKIRNYYINRWGGEHWPGGDQNEVWEYFPIIEFTKWNIGIFGVKGVYFYPIENKVPQEYSIRTDIDFCRLKNWYSPSPIRFVTINHSQVTNV
jgi:hypothetical protein